MNFTDHDEVLGQLKEIQEADHDNRERAREAHLFLDKRDGQWEPEWWNAANEKPRYTFDITSPAIDQICGNWEQSEFSINVEPAGGAADQPDAAIVAGQQHGRELRDCAGRPEAQGRQQRCKGKAVAAAHGSPPGVRMWASTAATGMFSGR